MDMAEETGGGTPPIVGAGGEVRLWEVDVKPPDPPVPDPMAAAKRVELWRRKTRTLVTSAGMSLSAQWDGDGRNPWVKCETCGGPASNHLLLSGLPFCSVACVQSSLDRSGANLVLPDGTSYATPPGSVRIDAGGAVEITRLEVADGREGGDGGGRDRPTGEEDPGAT